MIEQGAWEAWLQLPETKALRALAAKKRQEVKNAWEASHFDTPEKNWEAIGGCKALMLLEDLDYESVSTELGEIDGE